MKNKSSVLKIIEGMVLSRITDLRINKSVRDGLTACQMRTMLLNEDDEYFFTDLVKKKQEREDNISRIEPEIELLTKLYHDIKNNRKHIDDSILDKISDEDVIKIKQYLKK